MSAADPISLVRSCRLTRRLLLGTAAAAVTAGKVSGSTISAESAESAASPSVPAIWRTWVLDAADELRPAPPATPTAAELDEVRQLQKQRTVEVVRTVEAWASGPAVLPWTALTLDLIRIHHPSPVRAARALALLHAAAADAVVATWDAKSVYPRPTPAELDRTLVPLGPASASPSAFPSEHAAVAAAAAAVLTYLFPAEPADGLTALADEAATSRLWAGTNVRSDVEAGLALGHAVGERAIARGKADGSDAAWDGSGRPDGEGSWQPTPPEYRQQPIDPLAGTWTPWVVPSGDAYRPMPPPTWGSPAWQAELQAVQDAVGNRTADQEAAVRFWAGGSGTVTPAGLWTEIARDLVIRDGLDLPRRGAGAGADQRGDGRRLYLLLGRQVRLLVRSADHGRSASGRADADAAVSVVHLWPLDHLSGGRDCPWLSVSSGRGRPRRQGIGSQEFTPVGWHPFPDRQ